MRRLFRFVELVLFLYRTVELYMLSIVLVLGFYFFMGIFFCIFCVFIVLFILKFFFMRVFGSFVEFFVTLDCCVKVLRIYMCGLLFGVR